MVFRVTSGFEVAEKDKAKAEKLGYVGDYTRLGNSTWFTTFDHGRRHEPLVLMTKDENLKFSRHKEIKGVGYRKYANFEGIEVPFTDSIPSDYEGFMGVPISFLSKYNPDQFEIVGSSGELGVHISSVAKPGTYQQGGPSFYVENSDGTYERLYKRLVIRHKKVIK
jgi:hypothetical protein